MKRFFSRPITSPWQLIARGVLFAVAVTVALVCIFALLISLFDFSDGLIHTANQVIKVLAIGVGVFAAVRPGSERGLLRGALVGGLYMAAGVLVYALFTQQQLPAAAFLADLLMGIAAGGLIGLLRARAV